MSNTTSTPVNDSHIIRAYAEQVATQESFRLPIERDRRTGRLLMANASVTDSRAVIDVSWLAAAAEAYKISADIHDYVLAEVPIVEGDIPNRNMHCFLTSRLVEFLPEHGRQCFQTFIGKPTFLEHAHEDNLKAKGVIFDASMREVDGRFYVMILKGFDRTKDPQLADQVLSGKRKGHSMSAYTSYFDCAWCGHGWDTSYDAACEHAKGATNQRVRDRFTGFGNVLNGRLVYACPRKWRFFESSSVGDAANYGANSMQTLAGL